MDRAIIDNFLDDFAGFRDHCEGLIYDGQTNPVDNVFYPGVSLEIPPEIKEEIHLKISEHMGDIKFRFLFLRMSEEGVHVPHQAHTDASMGRYSLMLYMNNLEDCIGGTSFLFHKATGMFENPINEKQLNVWKEDCNNQEAWQIRDICSMKPNRALVFDSNLIHRAEPIGGFGDNVRNSRLVLTGFFDLL